MRRSLTLATVALVLTAWAQVPASAIEPVRCYPADEVFPDQVRLLTGDVDGDGVADTVRTRARWTDDDHCRARLAADVGTSVLRLGIDPATGIMIAPPGLAGLVDLDRRRGLEPAVVVWRGASTGFVQVYGVRAGDLRPLADRAFEYAGSIVHPAGVDCVRTRGAVLVSSSAEYDLADGRYHVVRRFYAFRAGTLERVPRLTERVAVRLSGLGRFPELGAAPFPSCTVVPGAS
jgi:hypothetical protein